MRITAVSALMPTALEAYACVGISNCAPIWWMRRTGLRSVGCWSIRSGWSRNTGDDCCKLRHRLIWSH